MAVQKITKNATVDLGITNTTAAELIETLKQLPPNAQYSVKSMKADPRDQRDRDWAQLVFRWTD